MIDPWCRDGQCRSPTGIDFDDRAAAGNERDFHCPVAALEPSIRGPSEYSAPDMLPAVRRGRRSR